MHSFGEETPKLVLRSVDYHRNGISGEGFYIVHFTDPTPAIGDMMAVVFPPDELNSEGGHDWDLYKKGKWNNPRVAVFSEEFLPITTFGSNSWRGDHYAPFCYAAISDYNERD